MKNIFFIFSFFFILYTLTIRGEDYDVVVVGGSCSGICAGIQAARMGSKTLIIEESPWLGGMLTSAGVSAVDGNYHLRSGLWGEFLDSLVCRYGSEEALKTGWVSNVLFEPSAGNAIFHNMAAREHNLTVLHGTSLASLRLRHGSWLVTLNKNNPTLSSKLIIDATEQGDVVAMLGVPCDVGMESRSVTGEDIAPEKTNGIVQDITYVATLKDYGHSVMPASAPEDYNPEEFACCCRNPLCTDPSDPDRLWSPDMMLSYGRLPGGKYMLNWPISGNDFYLESSGVPGIQGSGLQEAKARTMRFLYFIQKELGYTNIGLADDEYPTADHLPLIPYYRESRRIHGVVRFTLNDLARPYGQPKVLFRTGIAVGDYPVDQHHGRYDGEENLPDLHFYPVPSFTVPLGCLIPQAQDNLIVAEKSISVSNLASGATRLQPVVMQIGQAAGALASLAVSGKCQPREVSVRQVQDSLLSSGNYILPLLDVGKQDARFLPLQRIAATGLLKAETRSVGWSNEMWMNIDKPLSQEDVKSISSVCPEFFSDSSRLNLTRGEAALLLDSLYDPFHKLQVNLQGQFR